MLRGPFVRGHSVLSNTYFSYLFGDVTKCAFGNVLLLC